MQLLVLGMHRSGTSGVTRLLNMAGAYFGPEGIATEPNDENPKGFWERRDVRDVCDGLLHGSGFDWWRVAGFDPDAVPDDVREQGLAAFRSILNGLDAHRPWVLKEPRLCLVLPVLRPLLEVPVCIHVTREPLQVAASVHARNGFPVQAGVALWEAYTVASLRASEGLPRVLVRYEELVAEPVAVVERLLGELEALGVQGLRVPTEREITAFVSADLHRQRVTADERGGRLNTPQQRLAVAIDDGTLFEIGPDLELSAGALETLEVFERDEDRRARVEQLEQETSDLTAEVAARTASAEELAARARELETRLVDAAAVAEADRARAAEALEQVAEAVERAEAAEERADRVEEEVAASDVRAAAAQQRAEAAERRVTTAEEHARVAARRAGEAEERAAELAQRVQALSAREDASARAVRAATDSIEEQVRVVARSQYWWLAWKGMSLRQRLTPRMRVQERSPLERIRAYAAAARDAVDRPPVADDDGPPSAAAPPAAPTAPAASARPALRPRGAAKPKVAVVAWTTRHSP
jgi:hypothetical protein